LRPQADVLATEGCAHGFAHRNKGGLARRRYVVAHVQLDSFRDGYALPLFHCTIVLSDRGISARPQRWRECGSDLPLERIAGRARELVLDAVETVTLTLANLYRQQLQQMPIVVRRGGAEAVRAVHESIRYVKTDRACCRCSSSGSVSRPDSGRVD
jgi:hypothetical protein